MLRTFDIVLIAVMTVTATVTYSIKHRAELKLDEVKRLEAEIKLEKDTIDLLKADWALLTQPNRLEKLITVYAGELKLVPTDSRQIAQEMELPMLKADVPATEAAETDGAKGAKDKATDKIATGSVKP
ncbi:cell division protein FtsL [Metarhizobium album]|uniref:cell division protein FtsL n=1 Tax=Metarhizobium album TaxID=2182425 RepID=UPI001FE07721|nr:hypothetical protein [Rhizobium album]